MGLQTLDRAMAVLRLLGGHADGMRLGEVQHGVGLSKPTTHRLLCALVSHDLARQDPQTRRYRLGAALDTLRWLRSESGPDLKRICSDPVLRLAEESGDTVFLMARDRLETVCIGRESGSYPIRAITVEVGTRRPLGIGASGIAILGTLPAAEARRIVASLKPRLALAPLTSAEQIIRSSDSARRTGYAVSDGHVVKGVRGVAVSLRDRAGVAVGSVGIAAISERMRASRMPQLLEMLRRERAVVEAALAR
ncbi:MAG TPA: IclR family transcriptional regulator [Ramlibacter sp.]|nr:IclR family transcriptional regulator [Ramlibacter sp.]